MGPPRMDDEEIVSNMEVIGDGALGPSNVHSGAKTTSTEGRHDGQREVRSIFERLEDRISKRILLAGAKKLSYD